jgi:hypothetical protein
MKGKYCGNYAVFTFLVIYTKTKLKGEVSIQYKTKKRSGVYKFKIVAKIWQKW